MTVPVIIPVYGKLDYLVNCLRAIENTTKAEDIKIVLVDDLGPERITESWVREYSGKDYSQIVITNERNLGYTRSVNAGIRYAMECIEDWSFMVTLNTDTEPQAGWLKALEETVERAHGVGIIGAKLLSADDHDQIIHGGTMDLLGTHKGGLESKGHCAKRTDEVWVTGACMAITRECLLQCGLLDSLYKQFCSDSDYCLTARSRGFRVIYQPECRVIHGHSVTMRDVVDQQKIGIDQQRLLDKWGGKMLQEWLRELPMGMYRNQGTGGK